MNPRFDLGHWGGNNQHNRVLTFLDVHGMCDILILNEHFWKVDVGSILILIMMPRLQFDSLLGAGI